MSEVDDVAKIAEAGGESRISWWCPGCEGRHVVPVTGENKWGWNGSLSQPTLSPSVLVYAHARSPEWGAGNQPRCHAFMRDGKIMFLPDCEHLLSGQTVSMESVDE